MINATKAKAPKKKSAMTKKRGPHKQPTRAKILEAATRIFADYPYYSASIRMIGKAAGVDHPLVNYYFPTKAALFEEVLKNATETYYSANISWFEGLAELGPEKGLSLYIDRFFEFALENPKALRIITLNLVQAEDAEIIPGYRQIQNFFAKTAKTFTQTIHLNASKRDIEMLTTNFNTLAINYLGAGPYYAGILGMTPGSRQYQQWVKESLIFMILPKLKQLLNVNE